MMMNIAYEGLIRDEAVSHASFVDWIHGDVVLALLWSDCVQIDLCECAAEGFVVGSWTCSYVS